MRVYHNGVFKYWSGRIYDGGMETLVDLVDVDSVLVDLTPPKFDYNSGRLIWVLRRGSQS